MKTLQPINTILLTLVLLVAGIAGSVPQAAACDPGQCEFALYRDERPSWTYGNILTKDTWNVRAINTTVIEQGSSISRSGNDITLQPGTYYIHVVAQVACGGGTQENQLRLRVTGGPTLAVGHSQYINNLSAGGGEIELLTYITITSPTTFRIQHFTKSVQPYTSYGISGGVVAKNNEPEVYLTVHIIKVTDEKCH